MLIDEFHFVVCLLHEKRRGKENALWQFWKEHEMTRRTRD